MSKAKGIVCAICVVLVLTVFAGCMASIITKTSPADWFGKSDVGTVEQPKEEQIEPTPEPAKSTPLVVGDKIALCNGTDGLPIYVNTSDEALEALRCYVEDEKASISASYELWYSIIAVACSPQITEPIPYDQEVMPGDYYAYFMVLFDQMGNYGFVLATNIIPEEETDHGMVMLIGTSDTGMEVSNQYLTNDGKIDLSKYIDSDPYMYVSDVSYSAIAWFVPETESDIANILLSTTPFLD